MHSVKVANPPLLALLQMLKAAFPVASKPLYNTRLASLLRTMISRSSTPPFSTTPESQTPPLENLNLFGAISGADTDPIQTSRQTVGNGFSDHTTASDGLPTSSPLRLTGGALGAHVEPAHNSSSKADASGLVTRALQTTLRRAPSQPLAGMRVLVAEDTPILQVSSGLLLYDWYAGNDFGLSFARQRVVWWIRSKW